MKSFCSVSFMRYLEKCYTQIHRALYGDKYDGCEVTENICHWVLQLELLEQHDEINSSSARYPGLMSLHGP